MDPDLSEEDRARILGIVDAAKKRKRERADACASVREHAAKLVRTFESSEQAVQALSQMRADLRTLEDAIRTAAPPPALKERAQSQRMQMMLRHAFQCAPGSECAEMRSLWEHCTQCFQKTCPVEHCTSSRYLLSHYSTCTLETCAVCPPIRSSTQAE